MWISVLLVVAVGEPASAVASSKPSVVAAASASIEDREAALAALVKDHPDDPGTVVALEQSLTVDDEDLRELARLLLVRYDPAAALSQADDEAQVDIAHELARLLLQASTPHHKSHPDRSLTYWRSLTALTQDDSPLVRHEAQAALEAVVRKY